MMEVLTTRDFEGERDGPECSTNKFQRLCVRLVTV